MNGRWRGRFGGCYCLPYRFQAMQHREVIQISRPLGCHADEFGHGQQRPCLSRSLFRLVHAIANIAQNHQPRSRVTDAHGLSYSRQIAGRKRRNDVLAGRLMGRQDSGDALTDQQRQSGAIAVRQWLRCPVPRRFRTTEDSGFAAMDIDQFAGRGRLVDLNRRDQQAFD